MGHYIRILSTSPKKVPFETLQAYLKWSEFEDSTLTIEAGNEEDWEQVILAHPDGPEITVIEHNAVEEGSLASEEIEAFAKDVADGKPASAAEWLLEYFPRVQRIYSFQILDGIKHGKGWEIMGELKDCIFSRSSPSIIQADNEGFTNEDGYHILWQFSDKVTGSWWMAVLKDGKWHRFQMSLGSRAQRAAFCEGKIPKGAKLEAGR